MFSPIWGALSDRLGRRRILTITLAGNALSYLLWIFAAQFWVVVLTRLVCGMMAGNIAVASAAPSPAIAGTILALYGTTGQQERWLRGIAARWESPSRRWSIR